jgi:hypothetical protein
MVMGSFSILVSSDPKNGAQLTTNLGNEFFVNCSTYPIVLPKDSKIGRLKVTQMSIPYVSPNIITNKNDVFSFFYPDLLTLNQIVLPTGLYGLNDYSAAISLGLSNLALSPNLFTFYGDGPTQKVIITTNEPAQIDFSQQYSPYEYLGFDPIKYPLAALSTAGQNFTAPNTANIDTLTSYLLSSDIVSVGLPINGSKSSTIIASIPISNVPVGGRLIYDPQNATPVSCHELIGHKKTSLKVSLLDQNGNNIDMLNQYYSAIITFEFDA